MAHALFQSLQQAGKPVVRLALPAGSEVWVLPYGGRVLGLFPPDDPLNFFWTNAALASPAEAAALLGSERWQNLGGSRTWLAPEVEFFFPRFPDYGAYLPPRVLDGSDYAVEAAADRLTLSAEFTLTAYRARSQVHVRVSKAITAAANPRPDESRERGLRFAGFTLESSLTRLAGAAAVPIGLWTLHQFPLGGEMLMPTRSPAKPRVFFGAVGATELGSAPECTRYWMRTPGEHKIGLKAEDCTGRAGYLLRRDKDADLMILEFAVSAAGRYVDGPPTDPADTGYAFEACNVSNPGLGHFAEMEYHSPALVGDQNHVATVSRIWAYRGPADQLEALAAGLLGARFSP